MMVSLYLFKVNSERLLGFKVIQEQGIVIFTKFFKPKFVSPQTYKQTNKKPPPKLKAHLIK